MQPLDGIDNTRVEVLVGALYGVLLLLLNLLLKLLLLWVIMTTTSSRGMLLALPRMILLQLLVNQGSVCSQLVCLLAQEPQLQLKHVQVGHKVQHTLVLGLLWHDSRVGSWGWWCRGYSRCMVCLGCWHCAAGQQLHCKVLISRSARHLRY